MGTKSTDSYVQVASRIELQQLRYFLAVADKLNFSRAANELYVTQSLLSQQISALETELGVKLLNRNTKSVTLTPNGAIFLTEVRRILNLVDDAIQSARYVAAKEESPIQLKLICDELFDRVIITRGAFQLMRDHPQILCFIQIDLYFVIAETLENHINDIGITFFIKGEAQMSEQLSSAVLGEDWLDLIFPARTIHNPCSFSRAQIESLPLLLPERDSRLLNLAKKICSQLNVSPRVVFHTSCLDVIVAVELGNGFTLLPHRIAQQYQKRAVQIISLEKLCDLRVEYIAYWFGKNENMKNYIVSYFKI